MAKTIKFNLIVDKHPIRDLEDLRDHFNVEDVLEAYSNGSLKRWLSARELNSEIAALEKLKGDDIETSLELCRIFMGKDCDKEMLSAAAYPFEFRKKEEAKLKQFETAKSNKDEVIRAYHGGYEKLIDNLKHKGEEYGFIKAALSEIHDKYLGLFTMNINRFYDQFIFDYPLVILGTLANSNLCPFLISSDNTSPSMKHINVEDIYQDITAPARAQSSFVERYRNGIAQPLLRECSSQEDLENIQNALNCKDLLILSGSGLGAFLKQTEFENIRSFPFNYIARPDRYPSHVKSFAGQTEGYWKDIEPKGKSFLVIKMKDNNLIRNAGKNGEELKAQDINGKFLILDGIDYKSNNENHRLIYMEV